MGHHNAIPGPGANPALLPTAAEKAALDGASPALSGSNVVVGSSQITSLPTAAQKAALEAATSPNGSNPFMTHGPAGDLSDAQLASIVGTTSLDGTNLVVTVGASGSLSSNQLGAVNLNSLISPSNLVAARLDLLSMALSASSTGSTQTWQTGRTDIGASTHQAIFVYCPNSGPTEVVAGNIAVGGDITASITTSGGGTIQAFLFRSGPLGIINAT